jgi:single-stranded-DNA-specific exonuclease
MDKAVKRIKEAKKNNERVFIFGDYDVDGVTSTSILMHFFKKI